MENSIQPSLCAYKNENENYSAPQTAPNSIQREGAGRQVAGGLHSAPLWTAAAPHLPRPVSGPGSRRAGPLGPGRRGARGPRWAPGGSARQARWTACSGRAVRARKAAVGARRGRTRRGLTLDTIFLSWLSDTAMAASAPLRPRRQRVCRAGAAQDARQH